MMLKKPKYNCFLMLCTAAFFGSCGNSGSEKNTFRSAIPFYNTADLTPNWVSADSESLMHRIAPFRFVNQEGKPFGISELKGHFSVVNFFFTTCHSICPKMTRNLLPLQDSLSGNSDIQFVSMSVAPWEDSVAALKGYEMQHHIKGNFWHLLTGNQAQIYQIARTSFFAEEGEGLSKDSTEFLHTEHVMLIDKNLHIRGVYNGTVKLDLLNLMHDIRVLKQEEKVRSRR